MEDIGVKLERVEQRSKSNTHQIEGLKEEMKEMREENKAIYDIACSVKVMAERLGNIEEKVDKVDEAMKRNEEKADEAMKRNEQKLIQIENAPSKETACNLEKVKIAVITAVCTSAAVAIATAILRLAF